MSVSALLLTLASTSFDAQWAASLAPHTEVELPAGTYSGPWKLAPGVHITAGPGTVLRGQSGSDAILDLGGDARIEGLTVEVPTGAFGVRVGDGKVELVKVSIRAEKGARAAIFVSGGELDAHGGSVTGDADYGVLASRARLITVSGESIRGRRGAVAVVGSPVVVESCVLTGPFAEAAISLLHVPQARLARNNLVAVKTMGIKILTSTASLSENRVSGARADSDGLEGNSFYGQTSHLTMTADQFGDATSAAQGPVMMLLHSTVRLEGVKIQGGLQTLLYVAEDTILTSVGSELRDAPVGLTLESGSTATEAGFEFVNVTRPLLRIRR